MKTILITVLMLCLFSAAICGDISWFDKDNISAVVGTDTLMVCSGRVTKTMTVDNLAAYSSTVRNNDNSVCFAYVTDSLATSLTSANTYYVLTGTFGDSLMTNFTTTSDTLTLTGSSGIFAINFSVSGYSSRASTISTCIAINGTAVNGSIRSCITTSAGGDNNFATTSSFWLGTLDVDDEISLMVASSTADVVWIPVSPGDEGLSAANIAIFRVR